MTRTQMDPLLEPHVENDPLVGSLAEAPGKAWGWVLAYGVLLLLIALIVIANPLVAGMATGLLIGVVLVIYGIAAVASGWTSLSRRARWVEVLLGLLAVAAGVFAIFNPVAGALSLVWAIGAWLVASGVFQIAFALKAQHDRGWRLFLGALDVVLGLVLLFANPATGLAFLAVMEVLWERSPLTAAEVCEQVCEPRGWSLATVKTLLSRLVAKQALATEPEGKRFLYSPRVARDSYVGSESRRLVDRLFGGRAAPLFAHLAESDALTEDDIAEIEALLKELKS